MRRFGVLILCLISSVLTFAQNKYSDTTITVKTFELIDKKVSKHYKKTVIDSVSIHESQNLSEVIQNHSSVFIKDYGPSGLSSISFRGTGASHTQIQWNGVLLNSPMNGQIDFSLFPTVFYNNVELNHGATSLLDRNGALGGSVNIFSTPNFEKKYSGLVRQSVGSFGTFKTEVSTSYNTNGLLLENQVYTFTAQNDFEYKNSSKLNFPVEQQKNAEMVQYGVQQGIYKKLKSGWIGGRVWWFDSNRNLPSVLTKAYANEKQKDQSIRTVLEYQIFKNKFSLKASTGFVNDNLIYEDKSTKLFSKSKSYLIDNTINTMFNLNKKLNIINQFNLRFESANSSGFSETKKATHSSWLTGVVFEFDRTQFNAINRFLVVNNQVNALSPSFGGKHQILFKEKLFIKANVGINYHYPTLNDLYWNPGGNPMLKPEQSEMSDVGFNYSKSFQNHSVELDVLGFYNFVNNWILWTPTSSGYWSPANLKEVENKGFEAMLSTTSTYKKIKLSFNLNYAYTKSTNTKANSEFDNSLDKQLIYVPFHKLNTTATINFKNTSLFYNYSFTGSRYISTDNNWYMPEYFLHQIGVSQQIRWNKLAFIVNFKITNLLNQDYQAMAYRPMPGRNYLFSVSVKF